MAGIKNGINIRTMTKEDYEANKLEAIADFFNDEPLLSSQKSICQPETLAILDEYHLPMVSEGTCLVAIDEENNGRFVGLVLAGTQTPDHIQADRELAEKIQPDMAAVYRLFNILESKTNAFELYGVDKVLYSHFTFVKSDMRGRGLGTRLATALMEVGRSKGFPVMTANCTGFYSARQKEALGMKCIISQDYADYKDDQGQVIFNPPPPHKATRILAIKL